MSSTQPFLVKHNFFCHMPYRKLKASLGLIAEYRLNIELYVDNSEMLDTYTEAEIKWINDFFASHNLHKLLHGPFVDLNTGSMDRKIQEVTARRFYQTLEFAERLRISNIVLHTGYSPIFYESKKDQWIDRALPLWRQFIAEAAQKNIDICIENSLDTEPSVLLALLERINAKNCFTCFDPAHYHVFGKGAIFPFLAQYPPSLIREVHLSDNRGERDEHLPLGKGTIDFGALFSYFQEHDIHPIFTIEPHAPEDIGESLQYLAQYMR